MVHFVGAGCGAADLITLRGKNLIGSADVIIYAGSLVNPELLGYAKDSCEIYNSAEMTLDEVINIIKDAEKCGLTTVRLHTGDPSIYGAVREQMDKLSKLGIEYDVCPGVSSFCGAAASLKCEYTLPGVTQTVILTRMAGRTDVPERESIASLAKHRAAMVIFLSVSMSEKLTDELILGGYPPDTPAAVVYKATWDDERVLRCCLAELPDAVKKSGITKTALIIVGDQLGNAYELSKLYSPDFETGFRKAEKR